MTEAINMAVEEQAPMDMEVVVVDVQRLCGLVKM